MQFSARRKVLVLAACLIMLLFSISAFAASTTIVSLDSIGIQGNNNSTPAVISADGKFVAFQSSANNLVPMDFNSASDIFLRNLETGETTLVSTGIGGLPAFGTSANPSISADGRYVAFESNALNLTVDSVPTICIYVRDTLTNTTTMISKNSNGDPPAGDCIKASISGDGKFVAFESSASNLVPGDNNGTSDIFVRNLDFNTTSIASISPTGESANYDSHAPSISADGRYVAFYSYATNLVAGDINGVADIFVRDTNFNTTQIASVSSTGERANASCINPSISPDGGFVVFQADADNLVPFDTNGYTDAIVRDLNGGITYNASIPNGGGQANAASLNPVISKNGKFVAFCTIASNIAFGDTNNNFDVYIHYEEGAYNERISVPLYGESDNSSRYPSISADGRFVAFTSDASNLVAMDFNGMSDIFVRDHATIPYNFSLWPNNSNITIGQKKTISTAFYDYMGNDFIKSCYLLLNSSFNNDAGYFFYDAVKNKLYLRTATSSALIGGVTPGKAQVIDNGFFILNCAATTIERDRFFLTVNWNITVKPAYTGGTATAWMRVTNKANLFDPWASMGNFNILASPAPKNESLTPESGNLMIDTPTSFDAVYSDPAGFANIKSCYLMANSGTSTTGGGYLFYDVLKNKLYVRETGSSTLLGGFAPGSANVIDNGSIALNCADTTVTKSGNTITISWKVTLKSYFDGNTSTFSMQVTNKTGQSDPWKAMGSFIVGSL